MIDIFKNTEEFRLKEDLHPGFIYKKDVKDKNGKKYDAEVEIIELENTHYKSKITIGSNINYISYTMTPIEQKVQVIYEEEMTSSKKIRNMNYKLMSTLLKKSYQKKMKRMMMNMENHIQRSKE